jgi:hypothetical protein
MAERDLSRRVMRILKDMGKCPMRIESSCTPGCPDIAYIGGWIELKYLPEWSKDGAVALHNLRPAQEAWHRAWAAKGGQSLCIIQVERNYLAIPGKLLYRGMRLYACNATSSLADLLAVAMRVHGMNP